MGTGGLIPHVLLVALLFTGMGTLLSALLYPLFLRAHRRWAPAVQVRAISLWIGMPWIIGLVGSVLVLMPSILTAIGVQMDHCHRHNDWHHLHLCFAHPPNAPQGFWSIGITAIWGALLLAGVFVIMRRVMHARHMVRTLCFMSRDGAFRELDTDDLLAFSAGLRAPQIFISRGLKNVLSTEQLAIVLAHESAHCRRQDAKRLVIARAVSLGHLPIVRQRLLQDLELACERACDEYAATKVDSRLAVASTILAVERLLAGGRRLVGALPFSGSMTRVRVEALLTEPHPNKPTFAIPALVSCVTALALMAIIDPLHHFTETLLGYLLGH
jgi:Zn-dependent protease with chaperone function